MELYPPSAFICLLSIDAKIFFRRKSTFFVTKWYYNTIISNDRIKSFNIPFWIICNMEINLKSWFKCVFYAFDRLVLCYRLFAQDKLNGGILIFEKEVNKKKFVDFSAVWWKAWWFMLYSLLAIFVELNYNQYARSENTCVVVFIRLVVYQYLYVFPL